MVKKGLGRGLSALIPEASSQQPTGEQVLLLPLEPVSYTHLIAAEEYHFPVYLDHGLNAAATYRIYGIPTTLFIDSDGFLVERCSGPIEAAALEEKITALLGENGQ